MITLVLALAVAIQAPDSARAARWERALNQTTDSLYRIRGATAGFRVDLGSASPDLILVRAAHVRAACGAAAAPLNAVNELLDGEVYNVHAAREQSQLRSGSVDLHRALERCGREWQAPDHPHTSDADSLRAWGPYRSAQLDAAVGRYLVLVRAFMKQAALVRKRPAL